MSDGELAERFLVLASTGRDAALTVRFLGDAGFAAFSCIDMDALVAEVRRGAGVLIVADEVLVPAATEKLVDHLASQESWSDLPILLFAGADAAIHTQPPTLEALAPFGNVLILDRPVRPVTMLSAARAALSARRRQYQARDEIEAQRAEVAQRDEFLAMLGHELRNPLGVILLAVELLERQAGDPARQCEIIKQQTRHLAHLVDDLLDVARVRSGKITLRFAALDLGEVLARCVAWIEVGARRDGISVEFQRPAEPHVVHGDAVRLEQVFGNLLSNAVKYTSPGGHVRVEVTPDGDQAIVHVVDDGAGISASMLPHIFDLFAQAPATIERAQGGLGLGLTLVKVLVELHGGAIGVASAGPGQGSDFWIRLPLAAQPAVAATERLAEASPTPTPPPRRVLIVEDNADTRELLRLLLEGEGHAVEVAADGLEAVERALAAAPDVALIDIGLPQLDGYGVARRLRAELGAAVRLIALTGYGQPEDGRRALAAGFDRHCTKPIDVATLHEVLSVGFRRE